MAGVRDLDRGQHLLRLGRLRLQRVEVLRVRARADYWPADEPHVCGVRTPDILPLIVRRKLSRFSLNILQLFCLSIQYDSINVVKLFMLFIWHHVNRLRNYSSLLNNVKASWLIILTVNKNYFSFGKVYGLRK